MRRRLLSGRDALVWAGGFLATSALIVATRFTSADPDSSLYASLAARLSVEPVSRWIAPEWWGLWARLGPTGLYRDHPVGGFLVPAALARLGVPGEQAAYVTGIAAAIAAILLIASIVTRIATREDGRAVLVLLQLMPVAFIFRVRANQEYAMLVCTLVTICGLDRVRRSWWACGLVAAGLTAALLIKGLFVLLVLVAAALWAILNPTRADGPWSRAAIALALSVVLLAGVAWAYDVAYRHVTGEGFWLGYWQQQLAPVEITTPLNGLSTFVRHVLFYLSRLVWHAAPWSIPLLALAWRPATVLARWRAASPGSRYALMFVVLFAAAIVAILSPSDRVAERYVFSPTYAVAAAGIVVTRFLWARFRHAIDGLDARIPALPALTWIVLTGARVALGPLIR